jgi:hypothetical protein
VVLPKNYREAYRTIHDRGNQFITNERSPRHTYSTLTWVHCTRPTIGTQLPKLDNELILQSIKILHLSQARGKSCSKLEDKYLSSRPYPFHSPVRLGSATYLYSYTYTADLVEGLLLVMSLTCFSISLILFICLFSYARSEDRDIIISMTPVHF